MTSNMNSLLNEGIALPLPPLPPLPSSQNDGGEAFCYKCPWMPFSCICTGFRELLMLATVGKKSDSTVCSKCPALDVCLNICKTVTLGNGGMQQIYDVVVVRPPQQKG